MKWAPAVLLCVIAGIPVAAGLAGGLAVGFSETAWRDLLGTPGLLRSFGLSLWTGTAATAGAVTLAHLTLALAWTRGWSGRLRALSLPLLASPHLALAIGVVLLLSPSGLLLRMLSPWATGFVQPPDWATVQDPLGIALICGLLIKETPFVILVLLGALSQVNADGLMLQSSVLGYGSLKGWLIAVAPLLHRQGRLAIAAVLVFAVTNVEMALPLGPSAPPTLSILLLRWFTAADLAWRPQAFAGTWLLFMTTIAWLAALKGGTALGKRLWRRWATSGMRALHDSFLSGLVAASAAVALGSGLLAVAALLLRTVGGAWRFPRVVPGELSLGAWRNVAPDLGTSLATTVSLALLTAAVTVAVVLLAAERLCDQPLARRRIGSLLFMPLLLPQMAYLFGWQVLLVRLGLDGTRFAVAWSHAVFALPYVWAVLADARAALDPGYLATAYVLGAGAPRAWLTVTAPLLLRSILLAGALAFSVSVALYLPTLFAGSGRVSTLATEAAASVASGNLRSAAANGAAQVLAPLAMFGATAVLGHALFRHRRGVPG
jgi:putative thiamine transport system permease protein